MRVLLVGGGGAQMARMTVRSERDMSKRAILHIPMLYTQSHNLFDYRIALFSLVACQFVTFISQYKQGLLLITTYRDQHAKDD